MDGRTFNSAYRRNLQGLLRNAAGLPGCMGPILSGRKELAKNELKNSMPRNPGRKKGLTKTWDHLFCHEKLHNLGSLGFEGRGSAARRWVRQRGALARARRKRQPLLLEDAGVSQI